MSKQWLTSVALPTHSRLPFGATSTSPRVTGPPSPRCVQPCGLGLRQRTRSPRPRPARKLMRRHTERPELRPAPPPVMPRPSSVSASHLGRVQQRVAHPSSPAQTRKLYLAMPR